MSRRLNQEESYATCTECGNGLCSECGICHYRADRKSENDLAMPSMGLKDNPFGIAPRSLEPQPKGK